MKQYFSFQGRIGRLRYFTVLLVATAVGYIFLLIGKLLQNPNWFEAILYLIIAIVYTVLVIWLIFAVSVQRLHDLDWPTWYVWGILIPILDFGLSLIFLFKRGTAGNNSYGSDPLTKSKVDA